MPVAFSIADSIPILSAKIDTEIYTYIPLLENRGDVNFYENSNVFMNANSTKGALILDCTNDAAT